MNELRHLKRLFWAVEQLHLVRNHRERVRVIGTGGGGALPPPAPAPAPSAAALKFNVASNSQYVGNAMVT